MAAERRKLRFDDWDDVIAEVDSLRASGYVTAGWGTLSLGRACAHLALILGYAVDGFPKVLPGPLRWVLRQLFLKSMLRHEQTNIRAKTDRAFLPPSQLDDDEGIARLKAAIEKFRNHQGEYATHVALWKLSRDEWKHQQLWHCEHHLGLLAPKPTGPRVSKRLPSPTSRLSQPHSWDH